MEAEINKKPFFHCAFKPNRGLSYKPIYRPIIKSKKIIKTDLGHIRLLLTLEGTSMMISLGVEINVATLDRNLGGGSHSRSGPIVFLMKQVRILFSNGMKGE